MRNILFGVALTFIVVILTMAVCDLFDLSDFITGLFVGVLARATPDFYYDWNGQ